MQFSDVQLIYGIMTLKSNLKKTHDEYNTSSREEKVFIGQ